MFRRKIEIKKNKFKRFSIIFVIKICVKLFELIILEDRGYFVLFVKVFVKLRKY